MKQKLLNTTLYVFDVNPYTITEDASEATVIKVQEESYKGFVELNPDLVDKLTKYNYHVICVNTPEWAPYVEQEDPQEQLTFGIYGSAAEASIAQVQRLDLNNNILETWVAGQNLNFPFQVSFNEYDHFAVEFVNGVNPDLLRIIGDALPIGWQDAETNNFWRATEALSTSTSVGIDAAFPPIYKLYLQGTDINDTNLRVDIDSYQVALEDLVEGVTILENALIEVWLLTEDINDYDVSSISTWMNESTDGGHLHYWRNMPAEDKTIDISYVGTPAATHTVSIIGDAPITYIKELTSDKSTTVNTYANPTFPVTLTVTDGNILALSAGSPSETPKKLYAMIPNNFTSSEWTDSATGDICSITKPIKADKSCELYQKRTLSLTGTGIDETNLSVSLDNQYIALTDLTNGVTAYPNQEVKVCLNDFDHISYYDTSSISTWMTLEQSSPGHPYIYIGSMPAANTTINISYIVPVTLNVSIYDSMHKPGDQGISSVEIGSLTITDDAPNYDLSNENYTNNVTVNPGTTTVKFYSANGPITSIDMIKIVIDGFEYMATPSTDPVSGTPIMTPGNQYSVIDYDTNPASGNPWVSILIPTLNQNQEPFENNDQLKLYAAASGS